MAKRFYITKDLDVLEFEAVNEWGYSRHKHNFFELTFVIKGSGQHILNESIIDYKEGDIFFLTPEDEHEFVVSKPTTFGIIKFTEQLFLEKATFSSSTYWRKNIETVIFHSNLIAESIVHHEKDKSQLFGLYELIKSEIENALVYNRNVLTELFGALLIVLSRNLKSTLKNKANANISDKEKIDTILTYVRQNVLDKERIRIKSIAEEFYMSPNYVSIFIKKHAGISIQQYVIETKMKMAERLLKQTNLSINEIADKTGFVDASHFNRIFKKYNSINPSEYR
ncbi:AraC family transcriptional regulator [Aureibaculum sp. 2210JD6-5]|uniref:AraC family transcriptional regulator n=1 Tax=Aureibaculum sp. 2210JD6-5 TaxID=3103957 RepID=UPI002AAEB582|nr:AraC family transcriptional regulator [Aureibaculum sp. 2210JD6-5]MDY7395271.1 AraC family transcriptional regulator [Aureibaculum sp. 2210JD6-5]